MTDLQIKKEKRISEAVMDLQVEMQDAKMEVRRFWEMLKKQERDLKRLQVILRDEMELTLF